MSPFVSIVTPVYNGGLYLREAIESVLAQTYTNWEYVILDNASTDDTRAIAESFASRDSRIRVCHNETLLPLVQNHNRAVGLMSESAQFCKPLMADDWMFPECVEKMVNAAQCHPSIGLVCSLAFDGKWVRWGGFPYPAKLVAGADAARAALLGLGGKAYFAGSPSSMLIRADLVRKRRPFFNEANLHCDFEAFMDVLAESDFAFVHQVLSLNRVHEMSASSRLNSRYETIFANDAYMLHKYGRKYLSAEEFEAQRRVVMHNYYQSLARRAFQRDPKFWEQHRRNFQTMKVRFSFLTFYSSILKELLRGVLNPGRALRYIKSR